MEKEMKKIVFVLIALAVFSGKAYAQTPIFVTATSQLSFNASPDHNATSLQGTALVAKYIANYCQQAAPTNCVQVDLGKPVPNATTGVITIPNFFGQLTPNVLWTVSVFAQGPGGDSTAVAGNAPFGMDAPGKPRPVPAGTVIVIK